MLESVLGLAKLNQHSGSRSRIAPLPNHCPHSAATGLTERSRAITARWSGTAAELDGVRPAPAAQQPGQTNELLSAHAQSDAQA